MKKSFVEILNRIAKTPVLQGGALGVGGEGEVSSAAPNGRWLNGMSLVLYFVGVLCNTFGADDDFRVC